MSEATPHASAKQASEATARAAVLVLGMARSGTSALAHVLELLGVALGDELKPAKAGANDKGYFEHVALHACHVELFAALGHDWDTLAPRPPRFWDVPATAPARARLAELLDREFRRQPLFGFKDPELCLLFPLWEELLAARATRALPVVIARHPEESAGSFARLRESGPQHGLAVWLQTMVAAERATRGRPRAFVTYAQLLADPCATAERIGGELQLEWPRAPRACAAEFAAFLDRELHRHRARATPPENALEALALRLYAAFERAAVDRSAADAPLAAEVEAVAAELAAVQPLLAPLADEAGERARAARAQREELRGEFAAAAAARDLATAELLEARRVADAAAAVEAALREKVAKLVAESDSLRHAFAKSSSALAHRRRQVRLLQRGALARLAALLRRLRRRWRRA
ncbi:MAG: hypothetical protein JNL90_11565 [Planctomycetes bacterium]|nr:hypothetical protein [Planctomycetota bacterium]